MLSCFAVDSAAASVSAVSVGSLALPSCLTLEAVSSQVFYELTLAIVAAHVETCFF
jgi:hypothetical protein